MPKEKGIDFIICDHHRPGDNIPNAIAVLDPKRDDCEYPYKELCGCGVGFKLITGSSDIKRGETVEDLVNISIWLLLPLVRILFQLLGRIVHWRYFGLQVINTSPRPGIKALIAEVKKEELSQYRCCFHHCTSYKCGRTNEAR